ncbi:MAG TPA: hypothetical protein VK612_13850 [Pyrinomonadaceae bacterium]|nr:hypothetical protein [Pyrinomonadaceae bacterium]
MTQNPSPSTNLGAVVDVVGEMMEHGIIADYAIGGAVAAILHYEPFSTFDLDIFFLINDGAKSLVLDMSEIYDFVRTKGFEFDHEFIMIHGWPVQFVEATHDSLWVEAIQNAEIMDVDGRQVKVIDAEHLAAMWIQAGRRKDIRKIEMFNEAGKMDADILKALLTRYDLLSNWKLSQHNFSDEYQY